MKLLHNFWFRNFFSTAIMIVAVYGYLNEDFLLVLPIYFLVFLNRKGRPDVSDNKVLKRASTVFVIVDTGILFYLLYKAYFLIFA